MTGTHPIRTTPQRARILSGILDAAGAESMGSLKRNENRGGGGGQDIEFILGEELRAPSDPRDKWTTARAYVYRRDSAGIAYYSHQQRVVNTHPETSGSEGQYGTARKINGLPIVVTLSCSPLPAEEEPDNVGSGYWVRPEALALDLDEGPGD